MPRLERGQTPKPPSTVACRPSSLREHTGRSSHGGAARYTFRMGGFRLVSPFTPQGDQPQAIAQLIEGFQAGHQEQVLLGVTGSGKTFTVAKVVEALDRPTIVLSHNKTLAAQLYQEFKSFFPDNAVEYFV